MLRVKKYLIFIGFSVIQGTCLAAPSISSVEMDESASELKLTGSGFGSGPEVIVFDNFQKGTDGQRVDYQSSTVGQWAGDGWYGGVARYRSDGRDNLAMTARDRNYSLSSMNRISQVEARFPNTQKIFIAFSVKVPSGTTFAGASSSNDFPDVSSWKFTWALAASGAFGDPNLDLTLPTHVGGGNYTLGGNDGNITWLSGGNGWWSWNGFNNMSIALDMSSQSSIDYLWRNVSDKKFYEEKGRSDKAKIDADQFYLDRVGFPGWWGNGDNNDFDGLYDNIYVAIGSQYLARVEVLNDQDPSSASSLVVIPAKSWSNSEIILDTEVLGGIDSSYIRVVDYSDSPSNVMPVKCDRCPAQIEFLEIN